MKPLDRKWSIPHDTGITFDDLPERWRKWVTWKPPTRSERDLERDRLMTDPETREAHGLERGGRKTSAGTIKGLLCPACGRRSAYFYIEPNQLRKALCSHRNTCGWRGRLEELPG